MKKNGAPDLLWGAEEIGKVIGRSGTQTQYLLRTGKLPAKQVGERWVASRAKLISFFLEDAPLSATEQKKDAASAASPSNHDHHQPA